MLSVNVRTTILISDLEWHNGKHLGSPAKSSFGLPSCCKRASSSTKLEAVQLAIPNDPRYARLMTNLGIKQAREGW
ncbi:hypothetical protein TNCV_3009071 [Trichonephila clavipes]|nr:hypothetical protein TNCV_3009071 [Trichonephila clavipes]